MVGPIILILAALALFGWLAMSWRRDVLDLELSADTAYADLQKTAVSKDASQAMVAMAALSAEDFKTLYRRVHRVRRQKYVLFFLVIALGATVPTLAIGSLIREFLYLGPLVWGFQIFFLLIFCWVAAVWVTLRIFHKRKPGTLESEFHANYQRQI